MPGISNTTLARIFNRATDIAFGVILLFLTLGILIGAAKLFLGLAGLLTTGKITGSYFTIISDVFSLFILIELSRSLVEYFKAGRIRVTYIIDAGLVFVLREVMISLYQHKISTEEIYALSALMLVLGIVRFGTVISLRREPK